ncbi:MAG: hypothetical protein DI585_02925 [Pseudomonas fluorescens]|nr:MAG: hypothetical protein DI585_02925 [Pseudomonas fluorescens]
MNPKSIAIAVAIALAGQVASTSASGFESYNEPLTNTESAFSGAMFTNNTEILTPRGIIDTPPPVFKLIQALPEPTFNSIETNLPPEAEIEPAAGEEASMTSGSELPNAPASHQPDLAPGQ